MCKFTHLYYQKISIKILSSADKNVGKEEPGMQNTNNFKVASYIRLSREDGDKQESFRSSTRERS